ncbi:hypothetical protein BV25DRAFT_1819815 [Artomyces pyxidatus]|uniref:Uncharacterized protein n=1 Tax=Artomyces pyxidatus TaxID=48021 RepID=A0ACB8TGB1_9AGAM|nr:hypothetical protein BV25DRAFT_1819815 [Artomyces pyxidatus]
MRDSPAFLPIVPPCCPPPPLSAMSFDNDPAYESLGVRNPAPVILPPGHDPGALIIGIVFASLLYGLTSQQTIFYFTHFRDGIILRIWVVALWILETVTTIFEGLVVTNYFITHFGENLSTVDNSFFSVSSVATGGIIFLVQGFFIVRIRTLRNTVYPTSIWNNIIFVFFTALACFSFATSIQLTYYDVRSPRNGYRKPIYLSNISIETALDVFITVALVLILHQHRNEYSKKKNPIEQLILFFITRGIILTLFQFCMLIIPYALPGHNSFFAVYSCFSKIYVNSALVTLNNRQRLLRHAPAYEAGSHRCTSIEFTIPDLHTSFDDSDHADVPNEQQPPRAHILSDIELSPTERPAP